MKQFAREAQQDERRLWQDYEKQAIEKAKAAGIADYRGSYDKRRASDGPEYCAGTRKIWSAL